MEELVKEDSNANWQRDLSLSYNDVGVKRKRARETGERLWLAIAEGLAVAQAITL